MKEIKSPAMIPESVEPNIFLAGSIEMGAAIDWQRAVVGALSDESVILLNPRRDAWDSTWEQKIENPQFREQVEWELDALSKSDYIILYLDPKTKSPISLLEMGLYAQSGKLLVVCPEGFWRKGNVDIVCAKYGFPQFATLEELLAHLTLLLHTKNKET